MLHIIFYVFIGTKNTYIQHTCLCLCLFLSIKLIKLISSYYRSSFYNVKNKNKNKKYTHTHTKTRTLTDTQTNQQMRAHATNQTTIQNN